MALHDWTRVEAGIFHDFHTVWISQLRSALNEGLLPNGYYALAERHAGQSIADVLTLHASPDSQPLSSLSDIGGAAVAEVPPRTRRTQSIQQDLQRSIAIRHVSGHRLIALLEIVSPANKDRAANVEIFTHKALTTIGAGVHLLLVDVFPPGPYDPTGMHGAILQELDPSAVPYDLPTDEPATLASYAAGPTVEIYLEHVGVGAPLPEMPLFLRQDRYVNVPLEATYQAAYRGLPAFWRDVLEYGAR